MTDQCIAPHELDLKKLWDSTCELSACKRTTSHDGRNPKITIEVPILTCSCLWHRFQKEAEEWIAPGGVLIADPLARNRRINAAYAQLWLADNRFQWAGLAAFASKQVGCGLLHAITLDERIEAEKKAYQQLREKAPQDLLDRRRLSNIRPKSEEWHAWDQARQQNPVPLTSNPLLGGAVTTLQEELKYVHEMLALGNTALFLDVYPLHRFYMVRGFEEMQKCLLERSSLKNEVLWPIADKVGFGIAQREIINTFSKIEQGEIYQSVNEMAWHEQLNILQPAMYDVERFALLMRGTQASDVISVVTGLFSGLTEEIQLTLASQCKSPDDKKIPFSQSPTADLADKSQRMEFVTRAAIQFDILLKNPTTREQLKTSIMKIANSEITE
ncbi:DUF2515 family protein [Pseudomonas extremaustralis]|uniref:DUF2515 family protein n=1 Tax=Pseudomonas extremaustralis TaxID=359110 RepID=UPI0023E02C39|nr:hypothetical protein [Pseudomonas extremaustralis]MDF3132904.1 hypothetical protein [Pseudomonas extremaustralis]